MDPGFDQAVSKLECRIQLTDALRSELAQGGPMPSREGDKRRFVRYRCKARGILQYRQTLPSVNRKPRFYEVIVSNVSRNGIGFFHEEQLFPHEQMVLWIEGRKVLGIEVARCRKVGERCYEIGSTFTEGDPATLMAAPTPTAAPAQG